MQLLLAISPFLGCWQKTFCNAEQDVQTLLPLSVSQALLACSSLDSHRMSVAKRNTAALRVTAAFTQDRLASEGHQHA